MSIIFKYTLFSLQGHIRILQRHKVRARIRYFHACPNTIFHLNYNLVSIQVFPNGKPQSANVD